MENARNHRGTPCEVSYVKRRSPTAGRLLSVAFHPTRYVSRGTASVPPGIERRLHFRQNGGGGGGRILRVSNGTPDHQVIRTGRNGLRRRRDPSMVVDSLARRSDPRRDD